MYSESQQPGVYTLTEFARRNRISLSTTYNEIKGGRLTAFKVGRRTLVTAEEEKAWRERLPTVQRASNDGPRASASRSSFTPGNSQAEPFRWSAEFAINQYECLRALIRQHKERVDIDLRRWRRSPDGDLLSTERGVALPVRHLRAVKALIDDALAYTESNGLLDDGGVA
jgi:hypothetical protein